MVGDTCITWAMLALYPAFGNVSVFIPFLQAARPHRYSAIETALKEQVTLVPVPFFEVGRNKSKYLCCSSGQIPVGGAEAVGHCAAVQVIGQNIWRIVPDASGAPTIPFIGSIVASLQKSDSFGGCFAWSGKRPS